jgi:type I restriction enzyme S subunit
MAGAKPVKTTYTEFPEWKYTTKRDLLLARNGTPYVYLPEERAAYSDHVIRTKITEGYCKEFIRYALQQSIFSEIVETVSIPTWSISLWNEQVLPMPNLKTQQNIVEHLDKQCVKYDSLISKKEQVVTELEQYKKSLIYEYVTGKKEVLQ